VTAKVFALRGATPPGEPVGCVVELLEGLLAQARSGELRALAYAAVRRDGTVASGWQKPDAPGDGPAHMPESHGLHSAVATLAWRFTARTAGFHDA
jgi:hypothetical protein